LVHVDVDMRADDAHRSTQVRWRREIRLRGIVRCAVIPVQWFRCLFQDQGHSDFSLPSLQAVGKAFTAWSLTASNETLSVPSFYVCLTTQKPASVQLTYHAPPASFILAQKPASGSPFHSRVCASGIRGESHFSATLILLFGTPGYGDGADDVAALHDRQRAPARHDAAAAGHYQALKPRLPRDPRQVLCGLLETGCCISFVESDVHGNGTGAVHSAQRDHTA